MLLNRACGVAAKDATMTSDNFPNGKIRSLKLKAESQGWRKPPKAKIDSWGEWLINAGFRPRERGQVICVEPGMVELRASVGKNRLNGNGFSQVEFAGVGDEKE